jgi:uncharacterized protein HemX
MDKIDKDMDELNLKDLEHIPIPEGLEKRLSEKIDEWEQAEKKPHFFSFNKPLRYVSVAASIALVLGLGYILLQQKVSINLAEQDTYRDPAIAKREAERALNLLASNLNRGMEQMKKAKDISDKTEHTLNKQLKSWK